MLPLRCEPIFVTTTLPARNRSVARVVIAQLTLSAYRLFPPDPQYLARARSWTGFDSGLGGVERAPTHSFPKLSANAWVGWRVAASWDQFTCLPPSSSSLEVGWKAAQLFQFALS